jgi:hypothetical protein
MSEKKEMTTQQAKELRKQDNRQFKRFWLLYIGLGFTAVLSFFGGLMLPFMRTDIDVPLTWATGSVALFYGLGFLVIGEAAANFWFGKITDQDPDNTSQKIIAGIMIFLSVIVSATTALATSYIIAYWVHIFDAFLTIPVWAQKYIAIVIPVMMIVHACAVIAFKWVSDEAYAERDANARINQARSEAAVAQAQAKADYIVANAPELARQIGEMEAEAELDATRARLSVNRNRRLSDNNHRDPEQEKGLDFPSRRS